MKIDGKALAQRILYGLTQDVKLPISSVPRLGRATSGVILMRFANKNDTIAAATCLTK